MAEAIDVYNADEWVHTLSLLKSMADDGITEAFSIIACIYESGYSGKYEKDRGVRRDYCKALKLYQKAFEVGYVSGAVGMARKSTSSYHLPSPIWLCRVQSGIRRAHGEKMHHNRHPDTPHSHRICARLLR